MTGNRQGPAPEASITRRALLLPALSAVLTAWVFIAPVRAERLLAVSLSGLRMVAPGRVGVEVAIAGLRPDLNPTIEGAATVGAQAIKGPPGPVPAARIPAAIDLPAGRVRVGGEPSVAEFPPVPPLAENTPVTLEVTVRQGGEVATARKTGVLLLPTVIVPGYLNDLAARPDPEVVSVLEQRGYHADGTSPDLFWFTYASRSLNIEQTARALAEYVRSVVLPKTYAARINVVSHSLGGLVTRWNMAFEPGWDRLVNRFVMVGVPNEGAVLAYHFAWYPAAGLAQTPAARSLLPTFPFWQPAPGVPWQLPPDGRNPELERLNAHPVPPDTRIYAFYGNRRVGVAVPGTEAGIIGRLPTARFSYGPGDGIVLTASALGLPINGGAGVPGLAEQFISRVDLGAVGHLALLRAAVSRIADVLTDGSLSPERSR